MKNKTITLFCLICLLFVGFGTQPEPVVAAGNTYYVATTGSDSNPGTLSKPWLTPQHAYNIAVAGDTVYFRAGTYSSTDSTCMNSGSPGNYITFQNYPTETVNITIGGSGTYMSGLSTNSKNYLKFIGLKFTGNSYTYYGLYIHFSDHVTFQNCTITNTVASGIYPSHSTYVTIDGCTVSGTNSGLAEECISIVTCDHFEVKNCKVHDPASTQRLGIDMKEGCTNGSVHNNEIYNLPGLWNGGIYVDAQGTATHDIDIYCNLVHDIPDGGAFSVSDELGTAAITDIHFYNNISYNCGHGALSFGVWGTETYTNIYFINNTSYNDDFTTALWPEVNLAGQQYLSPDYTNNVIILNNIFYTTMANTRLVYDPGGCYTAGKVLVDHNLWYNSGGNWFPLSSTNIKGDNYIEGDPLFTSIPSLDFSIQSSSPAKDVGSSKVAPITDYVGTSRPQGAGYDIGAYEQMVSTSRQ